MSTTPPPSWLLANRRGIGLFSFLGCCAIAATSAWVSGDGSLQGIAVGLLVVEFGAGLGLLGQEEGHVGLAGALVMLAVFLNALTLVVQGWVLS